jgi:hypothetical protein
LADDCRVKVPRDSIAHRAQDPVCAAASRRGRKWGVHRDL